MRVGLTGGIASGKSMVSDLFAARGAVIVDADLLARQVVAPGTPGLAAIVARFGTNVLLADGRLDRARLGEIVFADEDARQALDAIVHPAVALAGRRQEAAAEPGSVIVHVIPLLVETRQQDDFDLLVVVDATPDQQLQRLMGRNGLTRAQAKARLDAQASRSQRLSAADVVIGNTGSLAETRRQVDRLWARLQTMTEPAQQ